MSRYLRLALLAIGFSGAALAQLQLVQVNNGVEVPVGSLLSFGSVDAGYSSAISLRLRNTGPAAAPLGGIAVLGTGFIVVAPQVPATLDPSAAFDFVVSFQPSIAGSYSATLQAGGLSVLMTGTGAPALTVHIVGPNGAQPIPASIDFGSVTLGSTATIRFELINQTPQAMLVPAISVDYWSNLDGFSFAAPPPSGSLLQPLESASFEVIFAPRQPLPTTGALSIGSHSYTLLGTGQAPPPPKATLAISLPQAQSGQQGAVSVTLDSASYAALTGTVVLSFTPAAGLPAVPADAAIGFVSGGQAVSFTVSAGDSRVFLGGQPSAAFSTGTTAGTLTFTLNFAGATSRQTVTIAPAAVGISSADATRQSGSIVVHAAGFDNTRTAGKLSFTFYDSAGNPVAPGAIAVDSTSNFVSYFASSGLGGTFALTAVFPVTGDASQITAFDLQIANAQGAARAPRTSF